MYIVYIYIYVCVCFMLNIWFYRVLLSFIEYCLSCCIPRLIQVCQSPRSIGRTIIGISIRPINCHMVTIMIIMILPCIIYIYIM